MSADFAHCDQPGWPSFYTVGFSNGKQNPDTGCPSGHSSEFCRGWNNAAALLPLTTAPLKAAMTTLHASILISQQVCPDVLMIHHQSHITPEYSSGYKVGFRWQVTPIQWLSKLEPWPPQADNVLTIAFLEHTHSIYFLLVLNLPVWSTIHFLSQSDLLKPVP